MREYVCDLGHDFWRDRTPLWCVEAGCPAPATWTGATRGFVLDSHDAWAAVWGQISPDPCDLHGCWLWGGEMHRAYGPWWDRRSVRREMWDYWVRGAVPGKARLWVCGQERCVRPSHSRSYLWGLAERKTQAWLAGVPWVPGEGAAGYRPSSHTPQVS